MCCSLLQTFKDIISELTKRMEKNLHFSRKIRWMLHCIMGLFWRGLSPFLWSVTCLLLRRFVFRRVERETRVTGKEAQSTMWRRKKRRGAPSRPFSHSHLPLRATFYRERDVLIRGIAVAELRGKVALNLAPNIPIVHFDTTQVPRSGLLKSCL